MAREGYCRDSLWMVSLTEKDGGGRPSGAPKKAYDDVVVAMGRWRELLVAARAGAAEAEHLGSATSFWGVLGRKANGNRRRRRTEGNR